MNNRQPDQQQSLDLSNLEERIESGEIKITVIEGEDKNPEFHIRVFKTIADKAVVTLQQMKEQQRQYQKAANDIQPLIKTFKKLAAEDKRKDLPFKNEKKKKDKK